MKDYDKKVSNDKRSESLRWNWAKKRVIVPELWREIYYYDFHWRITENHWLVEFEDKWTRYRIEFKYITRFVEDYTDPDNKNLTPIISVSLLEQEWIDKNHKVCEKKWWKWIGSYYNYGEAEKIWKAILWD